MSRFSASAHRTASTPKRGGGPQPPPMRRRTAAGPASNPKGSSHQGILCEVSPSVKLDCGTRVDREDSGENQLDDTSQGMTALTWTPPVGRPGNGSSGWRVWSWVASAGSILSRKAMTDRSPFDSQA
jgi:hypothetical protein